MSSLLRREDGIALVMALAFCVALSMLVFGMTEYVTSNQKSAETSSADALARSYAEAALDTAYSRIVYAKSSTGQLAGLSPSKPSLLGCSTSGSDSSASDCTSPTPLCIALTGTCPTSTYTPTIGTGAVYGLYTGTSPAAGATFSNVGETASEWILVATGTARNASGQLDTKTLRATVAVSAGGSGAVASVWNHVFLTAPLNPSTCQASFGANSTVFDMPLYVIGNLCLTGNTISIKEVTGGQAVDLMVGGKLVYGGNGDSVGDYSTSPATPITSGVVVGNCATSLAGATSDCATNYQYKVKSTEAFIPQNDPELKDSQIESNYSSFDPGPLHTCQTGTTPSPLADNVFDYNLAAGEGSTALPDNSGSGSSGGTFDLTPSSSYACISKSGTSTGYLIWNNSAGSSLTVAGITVAPKTLAINGSIFIDGPLQISQSLTYVGTAIIMVAGKISFPTSNENICAVNTSCTFTNWQGTTGNNDMLTLATVLKNSSSAIDWAGNNVIFMGSLWCSPSSTVYYEGNYPTTIGPMSVGSMNIVGNSFKFMPLPVIANMPVGAPVPPNVSVTINPMNVIG